MRTDARLDARDQRRVPRVDAEFAGFAGQNHEFRLAGEDLLFGADDVYVNGVCHVLLVQAGGGLGVRHFVSGPRYCSVFAFSNASSMPPTM